jgi:two-component system, OmpR family, sensor kinase
VEVGDVAGAMRAIECEAARMAQLIDDLLLLARLDEERPLRVEPCSLDEVVQAAVEAARVVDAAHPVTCVLERPLIIAGDAAALRRVADNLLGNARRHTPPRTGISVGLARVGDQAVLTVADTGPGIPVPVAIGSSRGSSVPAAAARATAEAPASGWRSCTRSSRRTTGKSR